MSPCPPQHTHTLHHTTLSKLLRVSIPPPFHHKYPLKEPWRRIHILPNVMQSHSDFKQFIGMEAGFKMFGLVESLLHLTPHFKPPVLLILAQTLPLPGVPCPILTPLYQLHCLFILCRPLSLGNRENDSIEESQRVTDKLSQDTNCPPCQVSLTPGTQQKLNKEP